MKSVIDVYDKIAEEYEEKFPDENEHVKKFLSLLPKGSKILDVGCGPGEDAKFATENGFDVTGIDASKQMIKIAKKNCPKGKFKTRDIKDMDFKSETFDAIIAAFVLQHVHKKHVLHIMGKFHQFLKKGGLLYMALQHGKSREIYREEVLNQERLFFNIYSFSEIEKILTHAGFSIFQKFKKKPEINENKFNKLFIIARKV